MNMVADIGHAGGQKPGASSNPFRADAPSGDAQSFSEMVDNMDQPIRHNSREDQRHIAPTADEPTRNELTANELALHEPTSVEAGHTSRPQGDMTAGGEGVSGPADVATVDDVAWFDQDGQSIPETVLDNPVERSPDIPADRLAMRDAGLNADLRVDNVELRYGTGGVAPDVSIVATPDMTAHLPKNILTDVGMGGQTAGLSVVDTQTEPSRSHAVLSAAMTTGDENLSVQHLGPVASPPHTNATATAMKTQADGVHRAIPQVVDIERMTPGQDGTATQSGYSTVKVSGEFIQPSGAMLNAPGALHSIDGARVTDGLESRPVPKAVEAVNVDALVTDTSSDKAAEKAIDKILNGSAVKNMNSPVLTSAHLQTGAVTVDATASIAMSGQNAAGGERAVVNAATTVSFATSQPYISPAVQAVGDNLVRAAMAQSSVTVRLDPPEMGRVFIEFQFSGEKAVTATIRTDVAETLTHLRDRAESLQQFLKDSGFDNVDMQFSQNDGSFDADAFMGEGASDYALSGDAEQAEDAPIDTYQDVSRIAYTPNQSGLDLRL